LMAMVSMEKELKSKKDVVSYEKFPRTAFTATLTSYFLPGTYFSL